MLHLLTGACSLYTQSNVHHRPSFTHTIGHPLQTVKCSNSQIFTIGHLLHTLQMFTIGHLLHTDHWPPFTHCQMFTLSNFHHWPPFTHSHPLHTVKCSPLATFCIQSNVHHWPPFTNVPPFTHRPLATLYTLSLATLYILSNVHHWPPFTHTIGHLQFTIGHLLHKLHVVTAHVHTYTLVRTDS